ncbi:MAG: MoxR family ATPase, partial [Thermomicrobiales bacterium]
YPSRAGELEMLDRQHHRHPLDDLQQVIDVEALLKAQEATKEIHVADGVRQYIVALVDATRHHDDVFLGASPRGSLALFNAARAWAGIRGRNYVTPDDVKVLAEPTLAHRIIVGPSARMRGIESRQIVRELLEAIPVPGAVPAHRDGGRLRQPAPARA